MDKVKAALVEAIRSQVGELKTAQIEFQFPPTRDMGDIGIPCFKFAKLLGVPPGQAAQDLARRLKLPDIVTEARPAGPYLNFFLDRARFAADLCGSLRVDDRLGYEQEGRGRKVLIEHTSINPNASPHVGRARNALIGDCLTRLYRFLGYDVEVHYYVNDMGKQIALLVMECKDKQNLRFEDILKHYVAANERAERDPSYEAAALDLLRRYEMREVEVVAAFERIVGICLSGQTAVLSDLGIKYDVFDHESRFIHDKRVENIAAQLKESGALFTDGEGRLVVDMGKLGIQSEDGKYFVLKRANGSSMYGYRDIAYTLEKLARGADDNIIVLGEDHKLYFVQLGLILKSAGKKMPDVVHYSYITLKDGKMSTRQGNVVLVSDFLKEAVRKAKERVDSACKDIADSERNRIAEMIGIGAVKFTILRVMPSHQVIFDWGNALQFEGDSCPYIQYSCARISSILRSFGRDVESFPKGFRALSDPEWELLLQISIFKEKISAAVCDRNPAVLAEYAVEIAKRFNDFYNRCNVLRAESAEASMARLNICLVARALLSRLLGLLGIETPEKM